MSDPRITAALDRVQREFPHDNIVDRLVAVLREMAQISEWAKTQSADSIINGDEYFRGRGVGFYVVHDSLARALAPLAQLGSADD